MHICLISLDYKPYRSSGLTIYAEDLAQGLLTRGHQVTVLAAQRCALPSHHWIDGVEVYRVRADKLDWITYSLRAVQLLARLQRERAFSLIHFLDVHFAYPYHGVYVASIWQSFRQRLTAHHGGPYHTGRVDWVRRQAYYRVARTFFEHRSVKNAVRLVASCRSTRDEFVAHYHIPFGRIDLAVQGINTELFCPTPHPELRKKLGLEHCRILLFLGFITPRKGMEYLGQAMCQLPEDVHLLVGGRWDESYRKIFRKVVGPAAHRVHDIGFLRDEDRPLYYSLADVYVSPSFLEGLGITPIEAMACGTPAVVTSATSGPEEVGNAGIVVPACDSRSLAAGIRSLLDDNELRCRLGQAGREKVLAEYSHLRMADLTIQCYERACLKS
ncbi:MAG: glycosyltransferase family 4 protein [Caldilinea sp.]|nr:glycosyltransferase family 4 protein [Anaerolineales bacterium]